jgi:putative peptide zinc metalloprotease protein
MAGAHPVSTYPPLAAPPGPPAPADADVDRRFERKLWWLLILLLLLAVLLTGANLFTGPVWAEMPTDSALVSVTRGTAAVQINGAERTLTRDAKVYVQQGDNVRVNAKSTASLTFRGGSATVLCAGADVRVGTLVSGQATPIEPTAALSLQHGRVLADTTSTTTAFKPLRLTIGPVATEGAARFALTAGDDPEVGRGLVRLDGTAVAPSSAADLTCGDGVALPKPGGTPTVVPSATDTPSESPSSSDSPSASASESAPASTEATPTRTTKAPTPTRTTAGPPPPPPTTAGPPPTTSPPPPYVLPGVTILNESKDSIDQTMPTGGTCNGGFATGSISARVTVGTAPIKGVVVSWSGFSSGSRTMSRDGDYFGTIGPVNYTGSSNRGGTLTVTVTGTEGNGRTASAAGTKINVQPCSIIG